MFNKKMVLAIKIILSFYLVIVSISANALERSVEDPKLPLRKLATREEAKALFDWAMVYLKVNGRDIAYIVFNQGDGKFTDRDFYIFCLDYRKV
jgi:hypothetical protein